MTILILTFCSIFVFSLILIICDYNYYEKKMPKESLQEILTIIEKLEEEISNEPDIVKQKELFDVKTYWEQQKEKLVNYHKKTGKVYEVFGK